MLGAGTVEYSAGPLQRLSLGNGNQGASLSFHYYNIPSQERDPDDGRNVLDITGETQGTTTVQAHRPRKAGKRHSIGSVHSDSTYSARHSGRGPGTEPLSDAQVIIHFGCKGALSRATCRRLTPA